MSRRHSGAGLGSATRKRQAACFNAPSTPASSALIAKGKKIRDVFLKNEIKFKYFKGNILNEFQEVTKNDGTPFKVFTPFWRTAEQKYLSLPPTKNYIVKKKTKEKTFFKGCIEAKNILPKKRLV